MTIIDIVLILIVGIVTWCVASEGVWGAAFILISVLLSGLFAMNCFEPLAGFLEGLGGGPRWGYFCDIIALLGLFAGGVFALRAATEYLMPTYVQVHPLIHDVGRWGLGLAAGYLTMAVLATSLHTAPMPQSFAGFNPGPNNRMLFGLAPDRQWLAFTQYVSEHSMAKGRVPRIFDGAQFRLVQPSGADALTPTAVPVWSSFPIRYADRRAHFASGAAAGGAGGGSAGPPQNGPPPTVTPSGGGGSSGF